MSRPYDFTPVEDNIQLRQQGVNNLQVDTIDSLATAASQQWDKNITPMLFKKLALTDLETKAKTGQLQSKTLDTEEANLKYGIKNRLKFDQPINEEVAKMRNTIIQKDIDQQIMLEIGKTNGLNPALQFGTELIAGALDPINIGSSFIPIVGQAKYARLVSKFGKIGGRAITGLVEGAVGNALVEPFAYMLANDLGYDYSAFDVLSSIAFGGVFGAGLHVGAGAIGDALVPGLSNKIDNDPLTEQVHTEALSVAVKQFATGENIKVDTLFGALDLNKNAELINDINVLKSNGVDDKQIAKELSAKYNEVFTPDELETVLKSDNLYLDGSDDLSNRQAILNEVENTISDKPIDKIIDDPIQDPLKLESETIKKEPLNLDPNVKNYTIEDKDLVDLQNKLETSEINKAEISTVKEEVKSNFDLADSLEAARKVALDCFINSGGI